MMLQPDSWTIVTALETVLLLILTRR
uniref:Uncharacterized protein n=1 Tax=Rhizophora mucronata TaxID=61149 RepID=A0A2P2QWS0_RHIMU